MKKIALIIMMVLVLSTVSGLTGHIYSQPIDKNTIEIVVTYFNEGNYKVKDLNVRAYMPYSYAQDSGLSIKSKDSARRILYLETEDVKKGYQPLIVTTTNDDDVRETRHTWVYIE